VGLSLCIVYSNPGPPKPIADKVDLLELALVLGTTASATKILYELDEWADSVGSGFLFTQESEFRCELWLYGNHKATWTFSL